MPLSLHDTRSGGRVPLPEDEPVRLYVCGVTPYDTTHVGHAFTFVQFDLLARALRWLGRDVVYVQNVTDIDESILARARERGTDWKTLGDRETAILRDDLRALRAAPDRLVPATRCMDAIRSMTATLLEARSAYAAGDGDIFFRTASAATYGELSRLSRDGMLGIAGAQDDADLDDPRKEDPLDFALWRGWSGAADEPHWPAPWGEGRPGWHIECSAINLAEHGAQVTIHGGGADLVYPHHEAEIVQSEAATGVRPFSRIWMHTAMTSLGGRKMSKSLGNLVYVRDLRARHEAAAIRLALLSHHYRTPVDWDDARMVAAEARLAHLRKRAAGSDREASAEAGMRAALEDDLDAPRALDALEAASGESLVRLADVLGVDVRPPSEGGEG